MKTLREAAIQAGISETVVDELLGDGHLLAEEPYRISLRVVGQDAPYPEIISAEQLEKEAFVMLGMVENIRNGAVRAMREPEGAIRYEITAKGRAIVEAMGQ